MAWRGSLSRSLISTARASTIRSSPPPLPRRGLPSVSGRLHRRLSFTNPRTLGGLGGVQSLLPLHSGVAGSRLTSHLAVNLRGCCELSHGIFCRTCQDR